MAGPADGPQTDIRSDKVSRRAAARRRTRRTRTARIWLGGLALLVLLAASLVVVWRFATPGRHPRAGPRVVGPAPSTSVQATLYFGDPRWTRLVPEFRWLQVEDDPVQRIRVLVGALADGPRSDAAAPVLPRTTRLRGVYLGREGLAILDFEPDLESFYPGGASGELLTVFGLVHTVCGNVPGVRSVQILIGGQERETLAGHVKISDPIPPNPEWSRKP
jgi:hypothetical protein